MISVIIYFALSAAFNFPEDTTEKEFSGRQRTGIILFTSLGFLPLKHAGRKIGLLKTEDDLAERNRWTTIKKINSNVGAKT